MSGGSRTTASARAITAGARAYAADAFSGSVYTREELSSSDEPVHVEVRAERVEEPAQSECARIVAALDVASTEVELAQLRASLVGPAWPTLTADERAIVGAAGTRAKARVESAKSAIIAQMQTDRESGEESSLGGLERGHRIFLLRGRRRLGAALWPDAARECAPYEPGRRLPEIGRAHV